MSLDSILEVGKLVRRGRDCRGNRSIRGVFVCVCGGEGAEGHLQVPSNTSFGVATVRPHANPFLWASVSSSVEEGGCEVKSECRSGNVRKVLCTGARLSPLKGCDFVF